MNEPYTVKLKRKTVATGGHTTAQEGDEEDIVTDSRITPPFMHRAAESARPLAIHITDTEILVLQLGQDNTVAAYGRQILPIGVVVRGHIQKQETLNSLLKQLVTQLFPVDRDEPLQGAFCVPKSLSYIQHVVLDTETKDPTPEQVYTALTNITPFPVEDMCIDYVSSEEKDDTHMVAVTVPKKALQPYIETIKQAGIKPILIDVEAAALGRSIIANGEEKGSIIVDIGLRSTALNIYVGQNLLMSVFAPIGSNVLRGKDRNAPQDTVRVEGSQNYKNAAGTLIESLELLARQLEHTHKELPVVETIYLAGRSSEFNGLERYLAKQTGFQTQQGIPLRNLSDGTVLEQESAMYGAVIGLALRADNLDSPGFNIPLTTGVQAKEKQFMGSMFMYIKSRIILFVLLATMSIAVGVLTYMLF